MDEGSKWNWAQSDCDVEAEGEEGTGETGHGKERLTWYLVGLATDRL